LGGGYSSRGVLKKGNPVKRSRGGIKAGEDGHSTSAYCREGYAVNPRGKRSIVRRGKKFSGKRKKCCVQMTEGGGQHKNCQSLATFRESSNEDLRGKSVHPLEARGAENGEC